MDINLKNIQWGEFEIGKLFTIENCKCSNISLLKKGRVPYVGATNRNNGVLNFVDPDERLVTKGNCIVFICDGEGSVGFSIYKKEDFVGSTTVKAGRNQYLNFYNALFITTIADSVRSKYNFGFKRNEFHLKKEKILLPINSRGEPDYEFMEMFMRQKEQDKLNKYQKYIVQRIISKSKI
jgi:Type I restriction modification DNA specificity domain